MRIPVEELEAAAEAGRDVLVRPWDDTAVLVRTKNADHMKQVVQACQPWDENQPQMIEVVGTLFQMFAALQALNETGTDEEKTMKLWVKSMYEYFINDDEEAFYTWTPEWQ